MKVMVRYYGWVNYETNKHFEEFVLEDDTSIHSLIELVAKKYGSKVKDLCLPGGETGQAAVTINRQDLNDRNIFPEWLDTRIRENDIVSLLGPISGAA